MEERNEILGAYKELKGVLASIENETSWFGDEGFTAHANHVIDRVGNICSEIQDISSYKLQRDTLRDGRVIVHTIQAKQKLNSLIGRIEGAYNLNDSKINNGNTFIQNQSQSQTQNITLILELQEKIITELPKYPAGSKERSFLEKLKDSLPTVKNITDILSLALRIGAEFGLDPATIHKLLGL